MNTHITAELRAEVFVRDQHICQVCKRKVKFLDFVAGHLQDASLGGLAIMSNLVCMCRMCNSIKPVHLSQKEALEWISQFQGGTVIRRRRALPTHPRTTSGSDSQRNAQLRLIRRRKVLSIEDLANLSGVGVSTISKIETGQQVARFVTIRKLAAALQISPEELVDQQEEVR